VAAGLLNVAAGARAAVLSLYSLPTIYSAYVYGRRHASLTAFGSALLVALLMQSNSTPPVVGTAGTPHPFCSSGFAPPIARSAAFPVDFASSLRPTPFAGPRADAPRPREGERASGASERRHREGVDVSLADPRPDARPR